jgi:CRISPR-associated protein Csc2
MKELFDLIPENYFVKDLRTNSLGSIKIALLREATGNLIIRNNYPDETTTFRISDKKDAVEIPARKLKSKEKLLGLKICREMGAVDEAVRYNVIGKPEQLANPNSVLFGDSVIVQNDSAALPSRVIYDWAYSLRDVSDITATLQHNGLDEGGTMRDETTGELRQSLYSVQYVKPGTLFPHFITFENVTPELFLHAIACTLFEKRYGAQSTTLSANNMNNHFIGIGFAKFEQPVNSFILSRDWKSDTVVDVASVSETISGAMKSAYGEKNYRNGVALETLVRNLWNDEAALKALYAKAKTDCTKFLTDIKIIKTKAPKS